MQRGACKDKIYASKTSCSVSQPGVELGAVHISKFEMLTFFPKIYKWALVSRRYLVAKKLIDSALCLSA